MFPWNNLSFQIGYDDSFKADLGSFSAAADYLDSMLTQLQPFFCHPSLGSKIQIEVLKELCYKRKVTEGFLFKTERWILHPSCWQYLVGWWWRNSQRNQSYHTEELFWRSSLCIHVQRSSKWRDYWFCLSWLNLWTKQCERLEDFHQREKGRSYQDRRGNIFL